MPAAQPVVYTPTTVVYIAQAVDTLTPLGRGQAQLLVGPAASGKSSLAVDAILGQHMQQQPAQPPVRCVYASVGHRYVHAVCLCVERAAVSHGAGGCGCYCFVSLVSMQYNGSSAEQFGQIDPCSMAIMHVPVD